MHRPTHPEPPPEVSPANITIAVTVFNRRQYILQAVESALQQTLPVKVLVVEDCGPHPGLREFVEGHFGQRIEYIRNVQRRGLFDNWNVCIELCRTPWLSILHDDDYLAPNFIETMLNLARQAPGCGIYFSSYGIVDESDQPLQSKTRCFDEPWRRIDLRRLANRCHLLYPGQLFQVGSARAVGGFRPDSLYCGDWDMWFKLAYYFGAAQTNVQTAFARSHEGLERGTTRVVRAGKKHALEFVQVKRNLGLLRTHHPDVSFDRQRLLAEAPLPIRGLVCWATEMSRRMLRYNVRLLLLSRPPHWRYALFQAAVRVLGPVFVRWLSVCSRRKTS